MLGAAGALCCLAAGTALGSWMRTRRMARWNMLRSAMDMTSAMRLLLETERLPMPELLESCTAYAGTGEGAQQMVRRFASAAARLRLEPMEGIAAAYAHACARHPAPWERNDEKEALASLFGQLGSGTAAMRGQAAAACVRRLKPLCDQAEAEAGKGGKLCLQLGMLLGLMVGIVLW